MTTTENATAAPSVLLTAVELHAIETISPAFRRATLVADALEDLGIDGFDTRFKIIFPGPTGLLPEIPPVPEDYYEAWMGMADEVRSPMRTYTIRDVTEVDGRPALVVDFVVHGGGAGPACVWAQNAVPGDVVHVVAPHRGTEYGGTEFAPGDHKDLLLIGDETTIPAIARILADLGAGYTGYAILEVPSAADILDLPPYEGIEISWVVRGGERYGRRLVEKVRDHLRLPPSDDESMPEIPSTLEVEVWETPRFSSAGEDVDAQLATPPVGHDLSDTYAWIAGESWSVKALRRALVQRARRGEGAGRVHGLLARGRLDEELSLSGSSDRGPAGRRTFSRDRGPAGRHTFSRQRRPARMTSAGRHPGRSS